VRVDPTVNPPHVGLSTVIKVYTCPADGRLSAAITDDRGYTAAYGSFEGVGCGGCVSGGGYNGAVPGFRGVSLAAITDGASNTLLIGERPPWGRYLSGAWYTGIIPDPALNGDPNWAGGGIGAMDVVDAGEYFGCRGPVRYGPGRLNNRCDVLHFWSLHSGGASFAFCDGSVRFLPYSAEPIMIPLATRAGGEAVSVPE
jgi:prepilin-type processing-associated H-X9-DG protein